MCFKHVSKVVLFLLLLIHKKRNYSIRQLYVSCFQDQKGKIIAKNPVFANVFSSFPGRKHDIQYNRGLRPD